jgi:hypothetical protein
MARSATQIAMRPRACIKMYGCNRIMGHGRAAAAEPHACRLSATFHPHIQYRPDPTAYASSKERLTVYLGCKGRHHRHCRRQRQLHFPRRRLQCAVRARAPASATIAAFLASTPTAALGASGRAAAERLARHDQPAEREVEVRERHCERGHRETPLERKDAGHST